MNRPALISVFSDQRRTKSTTRSRTSCGTHTLVRAPQDFFLRPCAQPSIRPAPHPSSGSSFPGTRSVVVRLGGPDGSWTGRQPPRSRRTLFANGRTPLAAAPVPHTDRKPALYPANAVLGCQPSLRQCSASALFACVLSVILTEERSLQFQLRQDTRTYLGIKAYARLSFLLGCLPPLAHLVLASRALPHSKDGRLHDGRGRAILCCFRQAP